MLEESAVSPESGHVLGGDPELPEPPGGCGGLGQMASARKPRSRGARPRCRSRAAASLCSPGRNSLYILK